MRKIQKFLVKKIHRYLNKDFVAKQKATPNGVLSWPKWKDVPLHHRFLTQLQGWIYFGNISKLIDDLTEETKVPDDDGIGEDFKFVAIDLEKWDEEVGKAIKVIEEDVEFKNYYNHF